MSDAENRRTVLCASGRASVNIKRGSCRLWNNIIHYQYFLTSLYFEE